MAVCAAERPPAITVAPGHEGACWLHARDLTAAQSLPLKTTDVSTGADTGPGPGPNPGRVPDTEPGTGSREEKS